jgi:hypothetical protein
MATRQRNTVLESLVREAGCPHEAVTARINALGRPQLQLTYGRAALSQWIAGHFPPPEVRELAARVLSAKLGRAVTAAQIWPDTLAQQALTFPAAPADSVKLLDALARGDVDRRDLVIAAGYTGAAAVLPTWGWLVGSDDDLTTANGLRRIGSRDVRRIHSVLARFDVIDHARGGGRGRLAVARYLNRRVIPLLEGHYSERVGRDLFAAAALVARKAGLMAADDGLPGLAQRYWIQALRMAKASGDRALGAHVLVSMSHQAIDLGQSEVAAELARAADVGTGGNAPAALRAKISIMHARALTRRFQRDGQQDRVGQRAAMTHIDATTDAFASQHGPGERWWLSNVTAAYLDGQTAHCHLELGRVGLAERHAVAALDSHSARHVRRRVMGGLLLAAVHATGGEPEHACDLANAALSGAGDLRSTRANRELGRLRLALHRHRRNPHVAQFLDDTREDTP